MWRPVVAVAKVAWVLLAAGVAYVTMGFLATRHQSAEHCPPGDDPDPIVGCFPSFAEDAWPHVELWGGMLVLFAVLSAPAWFWGFHRRAERRHLERRRNRQRQG